MNMKIEIILQILNITVTFIIGVFVTLHLGKFSYKKKKREDLISSLVNLKQTIYDYQSWYFSKTQKLIFYRLLQHIKNSESFSNDSEFNQFFSRNSKIIFDIIYKSFISRFSNSHIEMTEDFEIESDFFIYKGKNPYYALELLLLKLSNRENKKLELITKRIRKELQLIEDNFDNVNSFLTTDLYLKNLENLLPETKEIFNNWKLGYITKLETSEQIIDLVTYNNAKLFENRKEMISKNNKVFSLTDEYRNLIIKL